MSNRCELCYSRTAERSCYRCGSSVCVSCIDENGILCRNCGLGKEDQAEGVSIGYTQLKKLVNLPLFVVGTAIVITGMIWIMLLPILTTGTVSQERTRGFIYIFPFPFAFTWDYPDLAVVLPLVVAMTALPIIIIMLLFRKFTRL